MHLIMPVNWKLRLLPVTLWPAIFVTPHAAHAYIARVDRSAHPESDILNTLAAPLFGLLLPTQTLWGCRTRDGHPFLACTDSADERATYLLVRTVGPWWFWHEARPAWVAAGVVEKRGGNWRLVSAKERKR